MYLFVPRVGHVPIIMVYFARAKMSYFTTRSNRVVYHAYKVCFGGRIAEDIYTAYFFNIIKFGPF